MSMTVIELKDMLIIAAVTEIALNGVSRPVQAKQLARRCQLSPRYLEPALQMLVHRGILAAQRGVRGGYRLAREPARISAQDVLRAARSLPDSEQMGESALLERIIGPVLSEAEQALLDQLSRISIEDLMDAATATLCSEQ